MGNPYKPEVQKYITLLIGLTFRTPSFFLNNYRLQSYSLQSNYDYAGLTAEGSIIDLHLIFSFGVFG